MPEASASSRRVLGRGAAVSREANFVAVGLHHRPTGMASKLTQARARFGRDVHLRRRVWHWLKAWATYWDWQDAEQMGWYLRMAWREMGR